VSWAFIIRHERWLLPLFWVVAILGTALVNTSSLVTEDIRDGVNDPMWPHYVNEFTSSGVILALVPLIYLLVAFAFRYSNEWWQFILLMIAGCFAFSLIHIIGMLTLRFALFPLFGSQYRWGPLVEAGVYEFRKDALSYVTILGIVLLARALRDAQMALLAIDKIGAEAKPPSQPLSFRSGASTIWVKPEDILYAQAASNYVELHLVNGSTKLLRLTLSGLEKILDEERFVRTHRSYLVCKAAIKSLAPTGNGDFVAQLDEKHRVPVSRRYREAVSSSN